ncbi:MAG: dihydroorotate dehydrogenase electron transfer subunit [Candidatus Thorarchaeota archaeon]
MINSIITVRIKNVASECANIRTISFKVPQNKIDKYPKPKPGQFLMIWVPGVDEIPMSISGCDDLGNWSFIVKNVGECTDALFHLNVDDFIGIRGPYGTCFSLPSKKVSKVLLVAGGTGIAPLNFLAKKLISHEIYTVIIEGARVLDELVFKSKIKKDFSEILYCTDDGSYGQKGFATEIFEKIINEESSKRLKEIVVYTCGPEKMMYNVFQICEQKNIPVQASLERMMRCGCGLCGLCAVDPIGLLVCKDGPVFDSKTLRDMGDFGKYKRDMTGNKIPLN